MSDGLKKLRALLHELFQFEDADLDFGIYRILRMRREEVSRFLEKDLAKRVETAFEKYQSVERGAEEAALRETVAQLRGLQVPDSVIDSNPKVIEHRRRIALAVSREALEDDVFARLYDFFSRYYDRGDFLSRRSYRGNTYAVPYAGEEVKLHWANADQYYIKSAARHARYDFDTAANLKVRFEVVGGGEERDNTKAAPGQERLYQLDATPYALEGKRRLVLRFVFRPDPAPDHDQAWHLARVQELLKTDAKLVEWGASLLKAPEEGARTPLERHFERFRRSESFDYFIHKDLDGFLRRELDHYLKTEVMHLDDVESQSVDRVAEYLSKLKVIRSLAGDVITFLAQVEEFQKRLWLKKKLVLDTRWCVSLGLVPKALWPEVIANDAQRDAWVRLFAIDRIERDLAGREGYSAPLTEAFLEQNPTLVLDTALFSRDFTDRLLASVDDLEEKTLGTLFHAENFQALQLMQERYRGRVKCIYIDPPYNTGNDGFPYKDGYQHSSWLTMMEDRLLAGRELLRHDGALLMSIDEHELKHGHAILGHTFGESNPVATVIWQKVFSPKNTTSGFSEDHEYLLVAARDDSEWAPSLLERSAEANARYDNPDNDPNGPWVADNLLARNYYSRGRYVVTSPSGKSFSPPNGAYWRVSPERFEELNQLGRILWGAEGGNMPRFKRYLKDVKPGVVPQTLWFHKDVGNTQEAKKELVAMVPVDDGNVVFNTVKPTRLLRRVLAVATRPEEPETVVVDFFAGSGTTAEAVLRQNDEDQGGRRFVLVESGSHFEALTLTRVIRALHGDDWKDGVPLSRKGPVGIVQVLRLESYDDTLANLALTPPAHAATLFDKEPGFARDYVLRYMLEHESRGSGSLLGLDAIEHPFDRTLSVTRDDVAVESPVDLVETFHWLVGMTVRSRRVDGEVRISRGELPDGRKAVVLWRDPAKLDATALEAWFESHMLSALDGVSVVYVNGAQQLERLRPEKAAWRVESIEPLFLSKMFAASQG